MSSRARSSSSPPIAPCPDQVPENQKREIYERVRRALEAKGGKGPVTSLKVGSSPWDKHEQQVLEDGLRHYPLDSYSNMIIYIRIAAQLPKKTVRDVAHHLRHMQDVHKTKMSAAMGGGPGAAKRHRPDPAAIAMHEQAMAMAAANPAALAAMHGLPGMGIGGPGPHLKDRSVEVRIHATLRDNEMLINRIRENMLHGNFVANHPCMLAFDKNIKEVMSLLSTLPFAQMQTLPVQVNTYFISGQPPPSMDQHPNTTVEDKSSPRGVVPAAVLGGVQVPDKPTGVSASDAVAVCASTGVSASTPAAAPETASAPLVDQVIPQVAPPASVAPAAPVAAMAPGSAPAAAPVVSATVPVPVKPENPATQQEKVQTSGA
ncbi:unnamed protein product [Discosporangium mesarthrocarpum]